MNGTEPFSEENKIYWTGNCLYILSKIVKTSKTQHIEKNLWKELLLFS